MALPDFPTVPAGDVWGQKLIDAVTARDTDALNTAKAYTDAKPGTLVLGPTDPVPPGTPAGTVIYRTA